MEKIVKISVLLFLLATTLLADAESLKMLKRYDAEISRASNDETLRIYHGLQNIYIKSIISGDNELRYETLKRLVSTSKILHMGGSNYEKELFLVEKELKKPHTSSDKLKKEFISKNNKNIFKREEDKKEPFFPKESEFKARMQGIKINANELVMEFNAKIDKDKVKALVLKNENSYRQVYDIPAILLSEPKLSVPPIYKSIKIAQYNKEYIRVVLESTKKVESPLYVNDNRINIIFGKHSDLVLQKKEDIAVKKEEKPVVLDTPKRSRIIVLDAGHGGKDAGAVGYRKTMEKKVVLQVALKVGNILEKNGFKVFYTRKNDTSINLRDRTKLANDKNADMFVSIHANAAPNESKVLSMKGIETFFLSPDRSNRSKNVAALENKSDLDEMNFYAKETYLNVFNNSKIVASNKAAIDIHREVLKSLRTKYDVVDGGVREAPFWVLVGAQMPSILAEIGYITNPTEAERMTNMQYQKLLAEGIAEGIESYFLKN
ncbi:MAG: N-acetylmuramoyl-L-alanine amidase [Sulfurospirillaceae bacterium]|nr:N-acetylmuramoyl-L-alanine amidase [Sulfurospirillaceae bacterium]